MRPLVCKDKAVSRKMGNARLQRLSVFIELQLAERIEVSDMASVAAMSVFHFSRTFKKCTGLTPHAYIAKCRLIKAKRLLRSSDKPICLVAASCGYSSQSHMTTAFKRCAGLTPGEYRRTAST